MTRRHVMADTQQIQYEAPYKTVNLFQKKHVEKISEEYIELIFTEIINYHFQNIGN